MKSLYLVTHTEASHHLDDLVGGWFDSKLTLQGLNDAKQIAQTLSNKQIAGSIHSSDLTRALQTAHEISNATNNPVVKSSALREMSFGDGEGKPNAWLNERMIPANEHDRLNHKIIESAESRLELATRIYTYLDSISLEENQIVVTHGFAATFVIAWWIKMPLTSVGYVDFKIKTGSVNQLNEDDLFKNRSIVSLNR